MMRRGMRHLYRAQDTLLPTNRGVLARAGTELPRDHGSCSFVQRALDCVDWQGLATDDDTYASLIRLCSEERRLFDGRRVHAHINAHGRDGSTFLANLLVQMYGKCGSVKNAVSVFNKMGHRNTFSWNLMIAAYNQNGHEAEALQLYSHMQMEGVKPDRYTFFTILSACASLRSLAEGKQIHKDIITSGLDTDVAVTTALLNLYGKCHSLEDARAVFDQMHKKDVVLLNTMIGAYARNGHDKEALELFRQMNLHRMRPNKITFLTTLDACANLACLENGRVIHEHIVRSGFHLDIAVRTALLKMYGKCGNLKDARALFDEVHERDIIFWNAMLAAYAQNDQGKEAIELFRKMKLEGVKPSKVTFLSTLDACASLASLETGIAIHEELVASGLDFDVAVGNALIDMYGKCGSVKDACLVFDEMHERDVISWTAMIAAYAQNGYGKEGLELFRQMNLKCIKPDNITILSTLEACASLASLENARVIHGHILATRFDLDIATRNALVNMYCKCGSLKNARVVFDQMCERDVISWNTMILGYAQTGHGKEALELFRQMVLDGVNPDRITFLCTLDACASLVSLETGKMVHDHIIASKFDVDVTVSTALVNMYGKCGSLKDAVMVFDEMHERDLISWNTMIAAYAQNNHCKEALQSFVKMNMEDVKPDRVTFLSVLDACSSLGSLEDGKAIHECIVASGFDSDVAVRTALVNMYGKCGSLKDARMVFDQMHIRDAVLWTAMITACVQNGQAEKGIELFRRMDLEGIKPDRITFLSTLDACASLASLENGREIHESILANGLNLDVAVRNALVNMFGKCGSLNDARMVFNDMQQRDAISWNAMIAAYVQNGHSKEAVELFRQMELEGVKPDRITFLSILNSCSHAGFLGVGWHYFVSLRDYCIEPLEMHYICMIDLLGRAGCLDEAEDLIINMPVEPSAVAWTVLLGACRIHGDTARGICAAEQVFKLDSDISLAYTLLSNLLVAAGRWDDAANVKRAMEGWG